MWACRFLRLSPSPNSYPNALRIWQGRDMTNAKVRESTSSPLEFVGVDMAQQVFEWALHGVRGTRSAGNNERGFEALREALKGRNLGLILVCAGDLENSFQIAVAHAGGFHRAAIIFSHPPEIFLRQRADFGR